MPIPVKDFRQITADILRDILNQQPGAYVGADSDFAIRANAVAGGIEGLYEHQKWIVRQIFPDTADSDYLDKHASARGLSRKAGSYASGTVHFIGSAGSAVPIGTEVKTNNGVAFVTTASGVVGGGGSVDIAAQASVAGLAGNQSASTVLTLSAAPVGVQSQATIVTMTGGTDIESDADLAARVLYDMRNPPMGGAAHDYYAWAMEVPGVTNAYVFPQRRVINGVDVVIETEGGLPSQDLIDQVMAYIETKRPLCADVLVMAATLVTVNVIAALSLSGTTMTTASQRIQAALTEYFATLHVGDGIARTRLISLMMEVNGVADVDLIAPVTNVVARLDATHTELSVLGTVTLT